MALPQLGEAWYEQGEYARAIEAFEASLNVQRTAEDWPGYARTLTMLGAISMLQGNLPQAEAQLNEALINKRERVEQTTQESGANAVTAFKNDVDRNLFEIFKPAAHAY